MRKVKFVSVFVLLALLLSAAAVQAQVTPPSDSGPVDLPGLDSPVNKWSGTELRHFVDLAFKEQISVPQVQAVWEELTREQRDEVEEIVAAKASIPLDEWRTESNTEQAVTPLWPREVWRQPIENAWTSGHPPGSTYSSFYYQSQWCDNDPDDDWVFYFDMDSSNPDGLRWTSDSSQVYLVFMTLYGGDLTGFAYDWDEARLCIGTNGVSAAGGADEVQQNLFLHPNNE